ncbi:MAG: hypothetical protein V3V20_00195 [Algisphaera sp.]
MLRNRLFLGRRSQLNVELAPAMMNTTAFRLSVFLAAATLTTAWSGTSLHAAPSHTLYAPGATVDDAVEAALNPDNQAVNAVKDGIGAAQNAGDQASQATQNVIADVDAAYSGDLDATDATDATKALDATDALDATGDLDTADATDAENSLVHEDGLLGVGGPQTQAQTPLTRTTTTALESDGDAYPVRNIQFVYANQHPGLPTNSELQQVMVQLLPTPSGYVAPRPGAANQTLRLADLPHTGIDTMHASAANEVASAVVRDFQSRGLMGVFVGPDPTQIQARFTPDGGAVWGDDLRSNDTLRMVVRSSVVSQVRTVAQGDRDLDGPAINNPAHTRIRRNSPLRDGDLADRQALDDYIFDLNRHPGRTVAAEVFPGENPARGDAGLGYIVSEAKPWTAFFNLSNTGTRETNEWRERFGLLHTQLTGNDDILSLEYVTAGFEDSHAFFASYERPFEDNDRVHGRVYGSYQDYEASDVGFAGADFEGDSWMGGAELIWNFKQRGPAFFDLVAGARYENVHVNNRFAGIEETEPFLIPYIGVAYERATQVSTTTAYVGIETNLDGVIGTDSPDLDGLGRLHTDAGWIKLPFSLTHSFYLEPLFNRADWLDISTKGSTLAHEMYLSVRGQWTPSDRLNPQSQQVAGGLYTVRGYDEAITAGDTVVIATAEYRLHIPKLSSPRAGEQRQVDQFLGKPFRRFPQQPYGSADWDLIPKAFIDFGRTVNNDREFFESDETLLGAGLGIDFIYKRNLNFRADWGTALKDAAGTTSGSHQYHFSFTFLY